MSQTFINGAKYAFSTTVGAIVALTGISNANPAVAAGGSLPADGDIVLLQSNWTDLNDLATYAGAAGVLNQIDTTDETVYVPGEDTPASYRVMSDFVSISQIRDLQQTGGDTNNFTWGYIDDRSPRQRSKPTDQNPLVLTFVLDYDPSLPWADALEAVSRSRQLQLPEVPDPGAQREHDRDRRDVGELRHPALPGVLLRGFLTPKR
jgi:Phage tail tube protein, TTP